MNPKDDYPGISSFLRRGAERLETSDVKVFERYRKPRVRDLVPLQGSIQKEGANWEITVGNGFVIPRHNASGDTGAPITIADLPIEGAELTVVATDKCYVKLDISVEGKVTTATFEKAATWPTDTPPVLKGGDNATGTVGARHIRILEIVEEDTDFLVVEQIHTGHIDHFQPTLSDNTISSASTNQARAVKEWLAASGRFDFRYAEGSDAAYGVFVEESGDKMKFDTKGGNLDLTVEVASLMFSFDPFDNSISYSKNVAEYIVHYWRKGVYVGTTEPTEELVGDLITENVSYITDSL